MRTPMETIREAILHPHVAVRGEALGHFVGSYATDPTLMSLVIRAVEQFGRRGSYEQLRQARRLVQTVATVDWLATELEKDWDLNDVVADNHRFLLGLILVEASSVELLRWRNDVRGLRCFPDELDEALQERLAMDRWSTATLWTEFEELGQSFVEIEEVAQADEQRCDRFAEALARRPESRQPVLQLLQRRYRGHDKFAMMRLESTLVDVAGRMRLEEAAPLLVDRLHEDDLDVADACEQALRRMGSDAVVRAIAEQWPDGSPEFRGFAAGVLERIPSDAAFAHCLQWVAQEKELDCRIALAHAMLGQFEPEALETIRSMVSQPRGDCELAELQERLAVVCTIMGVSFPEREAWLLPEEESRRQMLREAPFRLRDAWGPNASDDDFNARGDTLHGGPPDRFDDTQPSHASRGPMPIRRDRPNVGRNAPCPCGSGRKYKKCCLAKDNSGGVPGKEFA